MLYEFREIQSTLHFGLRGKWWKNWKNMSSCYCKKMLVQKWNWSIFLRQFVKDFSSSTELFPLFPFCSFLSLFYKTRIDLSCKEWFVWNWQERKKKKDLYSSREFLSTYFSTNSFSKKSQKTGTTVYSYIANYAN